MCGICGVANLDRRALVDVSQLERMCSAFVHRGPDDGGHFAKQGIGLAIRRLAINDVRDGGQPLASEDMQKWLVCNGEIYNSPSLRRALLHSGHVFRCHSDVEAILHAYEEYGADFIGMLNGMFAFALWDEDKRTLTIARDRTGIKPLYYALCNDTLIFSSELKSLIVHPLFSRNIDLISLSQYLSFEYVPTPRTIYKGINKLPPGHILEFSSRGLQIRPYWDFSFRQAESRPPLSLALLKKQLIATLEQSVGLEMLSDVPLGVFLSGGLDSSAVAALATRHCNRPLKTFSLRFDDKSFDESRYARMVADHIGSNHFEHSVTSQMLVDTISRSAEVIDEPFGDSSMVPTQLLSEFASKHVKVVLGGDGGDELFAGYPTLQAHRLVTIYEHLVPRILRSHVVPRLISSLPVSVNNMSFDFKARRFLDGRGIPMGARHHFWLGSFSHAERINLLHPDLRSLTNDSCDVVYEHLKACDASDPFNQMLYCDMKLFLEGDILAKVDRASMAHSLEVRVPFLNLLMLQFASSLPFKYKLRGLTRKYLLKHALKGILPDKIINRPKKGFNMPIASLLRNEARSLLLDYLSPGTISRQGFFDPQYVQSLVADHMSNKVDNRKRLYTLLMFQQWYSRHIELDHRLGEHAAAANIG